MTLKDIQELNEKFQKSAVQLSELVPTGGLMNSSSAMIRSARKMDTYFDSLLKARSAQKFHRMLDQVEEEMDEILFFLDQLELANKSMKISLITDFLKEGYHLVAVYSKCCDLVIGKKVKEEE